MKKVYSNLSDLFHAFAQRHTSEGKSNSVFYYGDKIYSFGYHYLLAEFIVSPSGENVIRINNRGYSVSTAKHIRYITQATRHFRQFFTESTEPKIVLAKLDELYRKFKAARKPELYTSRGYALLNSYLNYSNFMEIVDLDIDKQIMLVAKALGLTGGLDVIEGRKAFVDSLNAKKQKAQKETIKKFMNFETDRVAGEIDFVRISKDGANVETSQRVLIPINEAKLLYAMIKAKREIKGYNLCGYVVLGLNGTLKIGCHHIDKMNMEKIGESILKM